jgi:hypothetical protein
MNLHGLLLALTIGLYTFHTNASQSNPCARALRAYSEEQILSDAGELLADIEFPEIQADQVNPLMGLFEPVSAMVNQVDLAHEVLTARDYATYLHNQYGKKFVYVGSFRNVNTPVFDGLVLDSEGAPAYNVSLKYWMLKNEAMDIRALHWKLRVRMDYEDEQQKTRSLIDWLITVNHWRRDEEGLFPVRHYERDLNRAVVLSNIFGLNSPFGFLMGRELMTVVDMRASGYTYEFVNQPWVLLRLSRLVEKHGHGLMSLTLLWDSERVIEFGRR